MLITRGDFIDIWSKLNQRGKGFILSKINLSKVKRTQSAFDESAVSSANWWFVPKVRKRWNTLITGSENQEYEDYLMQTHFADTSNLKMLSIGSGVCSHELKLAKYPQFDQIVCTDLVQSLLDTAQKVADLKGLSNIKFIAGDVQQTIPTDEQFDIVFFHASLHHFYDIDAFIKNTVIPRLKPNGYIVINEYVGVNRLQFAPNQIKAINEALDLVPAALRIRYKSKRTKNRFYGSGLLRMIVADPSECVDAEQILPVLHKYCEVIDEKPYGGNILMNVLKDISQNFVADTSSTNQILQYLFDYEDEYLKHHPSDFIFGVYRLK